MKNTKLYCPVTLNLGETRDKILLLLNIVFTHVMLALHLSLINFFIFLTPADKPYNAQTLF